MRARISIGVIIGALAALGTGVHADVRETVRLFSLTSAGGPGDPANTVRSATFQGGYVLDRMAWAGILSPRIDRTRGEHAHVRITRPDGSVRIVQLGSGGIFGEADAFFGESAQPGGIDPAGTWMFEFYEVADDVPGPDAQWQQIQFSLHDATSEAPDTGDIELCRLYGLQFFGRVGDEIAVMASTTSHNVGSAKVDSFASPDPRHPFINQNVYRLENDRFMQVGQSWSKHAFGSANSV
ncbi:MAG: hypothetical protein KDA21_13695, partial [Phycisphaerales bacterium]|nr:hypothetical protein [Phycisphaerales bacterium]